MCTVAIAVAIPLALGGCEEGFKGTVWDDDSGLTTLTLFDGGAVWEERSVDTSTGDRVVEDGLRFEGVYTESERAFDADVRCVSAENGELATPCDTKVAREIACALAEDDDTELSCTIGKSTFALYRRSGRRLSR